MFFLIVFRRPPCPTRHCVYKAGPEDVKTTSNAIPNPKISRSVCHDASGQGEGGGRI